MKREATEQGNLLSHISCCTYIFVQGLNYQIGLEPSMLRVSIVPNACLPKSLHRVTVFREYFFVQALPYLRHQEKNIEKYGRTPSRLDRNHPVDVAHLSHGNVLSVPRTFSPIYVDLHRNQVGTSWMSRGLAPKPSQDTSKAYRPPNSFMCVLLIGFLLPMRVLTQSSVLPRILQWISTPFP